MALARRHELETLKEPVYEIEDVPRALPSGEGSAALRLSDRTAWFEALAEMVLLSNRAGEEHDRRVKNAGGTLLHAGKPLGLEYMADRIDTDDPIWGWTIRSQKEGWLQGFVCVTTFTTWLRWFRWDTLCESAGVIPYERTPLKLSPDEARLQAWFDQRVVDGDGRLARALNKQVCDGDWTDEGVVWPRIAEISLLGGLGCGGMLLDAALEEMLGTRQYDFVVVQATENAVPFYESRGFVRVGAIAKYEQKVDASQTVPEDIPQALDTQGSKEEEETSFDGPAANRRSRKSDSVPNVGRPNGEGIPEVQGYTSPHTWVKTAEGDTPLKIARNMGVRASDVVFLNRSEFRVLLRCLTH